MDAAILSLVVNLIEFLVTHINEEEQVMQDIKLAIFNHKSRLEDAKPK